MEAASVDRMVAVLVDHTEAVTEDLMVAVRSHLVMALPQALAVIVRPVLDRHRVVYHCLPRTEHPARVYPRPVTSLRARLAVPTEVPLNYVSRLTQITITIKFTII